MDEIFNSWMRSEQHAKEINEQADTLVLTWTPKLSRLDALRILLGGAWRGRTNIATIKVVLATTGGALVKVCQQPDFETTETELMDSLAAGRSADLDPDIEQITS